MIIERKLKFELKTCSKEFPIVSIWGPRQSGKTTLSQLAFPRHKFLTLEDLDTRKFASSDPRDFLESNAKNNKYGIILDEVQFVPELLSYIKTYVDKHNNPGYFVLTGSQNFLLSESITQTLAGRVAILTLLPLSIYELKRASLFNEDLRTCMVRGAFPRTFVGNIRTKSWYSSYIKTYVERDVRQIKQITDLSTFQLFIRLCVGRIGQLLNISSLSSDCGISANTAKSWLSLLESSYILFRVQPHYKNFSKRLVKSSKIYFYDTGLACFLLKIENEDQLLTHYLRGNLFESFIFSEFMKYRFNRGDDSNLYFWRDNHGHEVDCIMEEEQKLLRIEIKSGKTIHQNFFDELKFWNEISKSDSVGSFLIYGGNENQTRRGIKVLGWKNLRSVFQK